MKLKLLVTAIARPTRTPTQCCERAVKLRARDGAPIEPSLNGTIHQLSK